MPRNPFEGMGSRREEASLNARARAVRAYSRELKGLLGTLDRVASAEDAVREARGDARRGARDADDERKSLSKLDRELQVQMRSLRNLDAQRERNYRSEVKRIKTLVSRYEEVKQTLREIQTDMRDTSTIVGTIWKPIRTGVDNMLRFGDLPKLSAPIREIDGSFRDIGGTVERTAGATSDWTRELAVQGVRTFMTYSRQLSKLNLEVKKLGIAYNDTGGEIDALTEKIVEQGRVDITAPRAVEQVTELADRLMFLKYRGVETGQGLQFVMERSKLTGQSFEESADELQYFAQQADVLKESVKKMNRDVRLSGFTIREDFVRAMMEASRQFQSQITDINNVAAAYGYAAKEAMKYGLAAKGQEKVAQAFTQALFTEREDAFTFMAGQRVSAQVQEQIAAVREELKGQSEQSIQEEITRRVGSEIFGFNPGDLGEEQRAQIEELISAAREGGLGNVDVGNMAAFTKSGIRAKLDSIQDTLGGVSRTSDYRRILQDSLGVQLSTFESRRFARMIKEGRADAVAEEIAALREDTDREMKSSEEVQREALTTVLSLKDPIQQLFNIKDYLKAMVFSFDTFITMFESLFGRSGTSAAHEYVQSLLGKDVADSRKALEVQEKNYLAMRDDYNKITTQLQSTTSESEREDLEAERTDLLRQMQEAREQASGLRDAIALIGDGQETETPEAAQPIRPQADIAAMLRDQAAGAGAGILSLFGMGPQPLPVSRFTDQSVAALAGIDQMRAPGTAPTPQAQELLSTQARPQTSRTAEQAFAQAQTGGAQAPPGTMDAAGSGEVRVGTDGRAIMTVRMQINNMDEVIAYSNGQQRLLNAFGIG
jgi:hypothetical protein